MARNNDTRRVQFTLPASLVDAIDEYCDARHMSRTAWVEYTLATSLSSAKEITGEVADRLANFAVREGVGE